MTALAHEPERRYPSAAALAEDLRRHLTSRPVEARPDSSGYRLRKFVMRHRLGVAASSVVATAVIAALAVSLVSHGCCPARGRRAPPPRRRFSPASSSSSILIVTPARLQRCATCWSAAASGCDQDLAQQPELRAEMQALLGSGLRPAFSVQAGRGALAPRLPDAAGTLRSGRSAHDDGPREDSATSLARPGALCRGGAALPASCSRKRRWSATRTSWEATLLNYCNVKRPDRRLRGGRGSCCERAVALLENVAGDAASRTLADGAQQPRASLPRAGTSSRRNQCLRASARDPFEERGSPSRSVVAQREEESRRTCTGTWGELDARREVRARGARP